jgi:hypothetical protein
MPDARSARRRTRGAGAVLVTAAAVAAVVLGVSLPTRTGDNPPTRTAGQPTDPAAPSPTSTGDLLTLTRHVKCRTPVPGAVSHQDLMAFRAVTAVLCTRQVRDLPAVGPSTVEIRRIATAGVPALQTAFERPDEPTTDGACPAIGVVPLPLVLVDASGRTLAPSPPVDSCHLPQRAFTDALEQVTWHDVSVHRVQPVQQGRPKPAR